MRIEIAAAESQRGLDNITLVRPAAGVRQPETDPPESHQRTDQQDARQQQIFLCVSFHAATELSFPQSLFAQPAADFLSHDSAALRVEVHLRFGQASARLGEFHKIGIHGKAGGLREAQHRLAAFLQQLNVDKIGLFP